VERMFVNETEVVQENEASEGQMRLKSAQPPIDAEQKKVGVAILNYECTSAEKCTIV
jgi:hypothetical protein